MKLTAYILRSACAAISALSLTTVLVAQQSTHLEIESPFGSFVEPDFPFFTQTLDAREFGDHPEPSNLTPRGIIVKLGEGHYGCFDPDLLRWSLIWKANDRGEFLTMDGMAPGSYRLPNRKAPAGQESLPKPIGTPLYASPAHAGWGKEKRTTFSDPRSQGAAEKGEIGRGPVPAELGRFTGIRLVEDGVQLEFEIAGQAVVERLEVINGELQRQVHGAADLARQPITGTTLVVVDKLAAEPDSSPPPRIWVSDVTTGASTAEVEGRAITYDDVPLPIPNPWKRNVRLAGFDFFPDGRAAFCTFDGDVWIADGLTEGSTETTWSRFASGLHEPKTICIMDEAIYVSDRNGIVRLHDTDGNGEADWYENFSNIVPQTAETREFAMDMIAAAGGGFFLAKGGQVGNTKGIANGTVVKVAPDGLSYEVIATGLRQPYLGYDPESGILTSSDQQGHWKPATPIYRIETGKYYGFQPAKLKAKAIHPAPIAPPEIWIPHFINQSGASQVWLNGKAKMGDLNGSLIHIGYNRPEIFKVYLDESRSQGAVAPLLAGFPAGILKGRVNPVDGRLYVAGFEIWGTSGERISGLFRVHPGEQPSLSLPVSIRASARGVLLEFREPLAQELATELGRYSIDRWNYEQTHEYGSGNFRLDGEPGQESVPVSSAMLSEDRKSLFLGLPDMQPSHSLRVTYRLPHPEVTAIDSVYLTVHRLDEINLTERGFENNQVDLTPQEAIASAGASLEPNAELGKKVAMQYGCIACHANGESSVAAVDAGSAMAVGPAWTGLWKSRREFTDGSFIKRVDETYLRESILDPGRRVAQGYATEKTGVGMPSYLGVLKDHEIESIILYIKDLK